MRTLAATLCAIALLVGCASTVPVRSHSHSSTTFLRSTPHSASGAGRSRSDAALSCPLETARTPPRGARLATDPVSAIACLVNEPPQKRQPGAPLRADLSRSIARLVDAAPLATPAQSARCALTRRYVAVVIRFGFPDGSTADLSDEAPDCDGIVFVGAQGHAAGTVLSEFLFDLTEQRSQPPDVLGDALPVAAAAARHAGMTLEPPDEIRTTASGPGSVLLESLLGGQLSVVIAVPAAAPCTKSQLRVQYLPGGVGAGNDFVDITFRDVSTTWCELRGPIAVTALDAAGRPVAATARTAVPAGLVLSPRTPPITAVGSVPSGSLVATVLVGSGYQCQPNWIVPASLGIRLPAASFTVANGRGIAGRVPGSTALEICGRQLNIQPPPSLAG